MHFSIPDIEKLKEGNSSYTSYILYLNGLPHSSLRYRKLREFYSTIKLKYGNSIKLPSFPSKNILMSDYEIEERREMLEKFLQLITQNSSIIEDEYVQQILLDSHIEFHNLFIDIMHISANTIQSLNNNAIINNQNGASLSQANLQIYYSLKPPFQKYIKIPTHICKNLNTNNIIKLYAENTNILNQYLSYLGLYLVYLHCPSPKTSSLMNLKNLGHKDDAAEHKVIYINRLTDTECPYLALQTLTCTCNQEYRNSMGLSGPYILIRTNYWDCALDGYITSSEKTAEILYYQLWNDGFLKASQISKSDHLASSPSYSTRAREAINNYEGPLSRGFLPLTQTGINEFKITTGHNAGPSLRCETLHLGLNGLLIFCQAKNLASNHDTKDLNGYSNRDKKLCSHSKAITENFTNGHHPVAGSDAILIANGSYRKSNLHTDDSTHNSGQYDKDVLFFKTCRIKSWRISSYPGATPVFSSSPTTSENLPDHVTQQRPANHNNAKHYCTNRVRYKFSFQYLTPNQEFEWFHLENVEYPLFLSSCLHGIVNELMRRDSAHSGDKAKYSTAHSDLDSIRSYKDKSCFMEEQIEPLLIRSKSPAKATRSSAGNEFKGRCNIAKKVVELKPFDSIERLRSDLITHPRVI
ncbi:unnamed protein product [Gordionus sp. m RMFG-2023]|uniref:uncharacterized protein LOC135931205 n=1 Tax=Gordionus sp. m RMFG-2023 TaxID=3053472 RepID=UPI0030DF27E3